ncbi:MAG: hypothetical protein K9M54_04415 [Kiritimatiellales bacterium]|nr:hypothetical protein [Kiritimatiellales bacterium]
MDEENADNSSEVDLLLSLLQVATSISVVSAFLKSKNLTHSAGSWDALIETRIRPHLTARKIQISDLRNLLAEVEEYGRSHIFLFDYANGDVAKLMDQDSIREICKQRGLDILDHPITLGCPTTPSLSEIRFEESPSGSKQIVFKVVETRVEQKYRGERREGELLIKEWEVNEIRAVNIALLHESGLLEVRIQSDRGSNYQDALSRFWGTGLRHFLPRHDFSRHPLGIAKARLWAERMDLREKIRFTDASAKNTCGTTLKISRSTLETPDGRVAADLVDDHGADVSMTSFLREAGSYCAESNIWWLKNDGRLSKELHMLLSGENNEFAIPANCTKADYGYVLNELRFYSQ